MKLVKDSLERWRGSAVGQGSFYSLILLDYSMPNIDGPETAKRINKMYEEESNYSNVPYRPYMVCLTAFTETIFEDKAREAGMSEFVSKPISQARIKEILRKCRLIGLSD